VEKYTTATMQTIFIDLPLRLPPEQTANPA